MIALDITAMVNAANLACTDDVGELADALEECGRTDEAMELRRVSAEPLFRDEGRIYRLCAVEIEGRRWFQRSYGNTYHVAIVLLSCRQGDRAVTISRKSEITYGYGSQYECTARELLRSIDPESPAFEPILRRTDYGSTSWALWQWFRDELALPYSSDVIDVRRQKDL
jgi:hypothetical protein